MGTLLSGSQSVWPVRARNRTTNLLTCLSVLTNYGTQPPQSWIKNHFYLNHKIQTLIYSFFKKNLKHKMLISYMVLSKPTPQLLVLAFDAEAGTGSLHITGSLSFFFQHSSFAPPLFSTPILPTYWPCAPSVWILGRSILYVDLSVNDNTQNTVSDAI